MKDYEALSRAHFNRQAAQYDRNTSVYYSGPAKLSCQDAAAFLRDKPYRRLLDVGCGTGHLLQLLARQSRVFMHNIRFSFVLSRQAVRLPCSQSLG